MNPCPLGTDAALEAAAVQDLLQSLVEKPLGAVDGRELTSRSTGEGIIFGLYLEEFWPGVTDGLTKLQAGRPDALLALRDASYGRSATLGINCVDEERLTDANGSRITPAVITQAGSGGAPASQNR